MPQKPKKVLKRQQHNVNRRPNRGAVGALNNLDVVIEIPNIDFTDGYSQSAKPIIFMLLDTCKKERLKTKIICRNLAKRNMRSTRESRIIDSMLIKYNSNYHTKVFFRYHPPPIYREPPKEERYISMTMFETDKVPPTWLSLDKTELIINPTDWGAGIFRKYLKTPVITVPLPTNEMFYELFNIDGLVNTGDKFRILTVGNYFYPDRKRLIDLIEMFGRTFSVHDEVELYVKTTIMDKMERTPNIHDVCAKYDNVILDTKSYTTKELIDLYCTSHLAVFPSYGEGFGMPHAELAMLGRTLVVADNTALSSMADHMPSVYRVPCPVAIPANYELQAIASPGRWFKCDMDKFLSECVQEYYLWKSDKDAYKERIYANHIDHTLRDYIDYGRIKSLLSEALLSQYEQCN